MSKGWKYGLILVDVDEDGDEICELVELYPLGDNGEYDAWCRARVGSPEELATANRDVQRDGINRWFFDNGKFEWKYTGEEGWHWDWTPNEKEA